MHVYTVLGLRKKNLLTFLGLFLFFIFVTINFLEWLVSFFFSLTLTINFWRLVYFYFSNWLRWRRIVFICFPDLWCLGFLLSAPEQKGVSYWKWTFPDHLGTANKKPWMFLLHPSLSREIDGKAKFRSSEPQICYTNFFKVNKIYNKQLSKQKDAQQQAFQANRATTKSFLSKKGYNKKRSSKKGHNEKCSKSKGCNKKLSTQKGDGRLFLFSNF